MTREEILKKINELEAEVNNGKFSPTILGEIKHLIEQLEELDKKKEGKTA